MIVEAKNALEIVQEYIASNIVRARSGRKCVDGRYLPNQASGMIARPGGDLGYVMALMGVNKRKNLGLTPEKCFNEVYKVVSRGKVNHFYMHTDHHADPDPKTQKALIGCGHAAKAAQENLSKEYGLVADDVARLVRYARNVADITQGVEIVNLQGAHEEAGVLVVNSEKFTVNSKDPNLGSMYFVYDGQRDTDFLRNIAFQMAIPGVSFEEMKKESDLQLQATLHNLAQGLPIYKVGFRGKTPIASFLSIVS